MCERYTYGVPILSITSHILSLSVLLSLILGSLQSVAQARVFRVAQPQLLTHVLINEFMPAPTPGHEEWLELYNPGESAVDISGWKIDDDTPVSYTHLIRPRAAYHWSYFPVGL